MTEPLVFVVPGTPQGKGRPRFSEQTIVCERCKSSTPKTAAVQKYCKDCSRAADHERKTRWAKENPRRASDSRPWRKRRQADLKAAAAERSGEASLSLIGSLPALTAPNLAWYVRFAIPYQQAASKNHVWSLSKSGGGHIFQRKASNNYKLAIAQMLAERLRDEQIVPVANKVWVDIFVQKPNHKSDAINTLDVIADGLKAGLGVDDRWFSVRQIDWQINKRDPHIFIGVGQEETAEARSCSLCGGIKTLSKFALKSRSAGTRSRVCIECSSVPGAEKDSGDAAV